MSGRSLPRVWALSLMKTTEAFMDLTVLSVSVSKLERARLRPVAYPVNAKVLR